MSYWSWDEITNQQIELISAPRPAQLAASIVPDQNLDEAYQEMVSQRTGLPHLGLIEWSISQDVVALFRLLHGAGSRTGYVVELGRDFDPLSYCRKIALDDSTAEQIAKDETLDLPMAFVDEQAICAATSWHSDYALICMREDLFETWIARPDFDLTVWENEDPYPRPDNLQAAQALAKRRLESWNAVMRNQGA